MLARLLAADPPSGPSGGSDLPFPELPDGSPPWVYAVVFGAVAIVFVVVKLPAIIDQVNSLLGRDKVAPAPVEQQVPPPPGLGPQQAAVDQDAELLRVLVEDLRGQVRTATETNTALGDRLDRTDDALTEERVKNARLEVEATQMRTELAVYRRQAGHHYFGGV